MYISNAVNTFQYFAEYNLTFGLVQDKSDGCYCACSSTLDWIATAMITTEQYETFGGSTEILINL